MFIHGFDLEAINQAHCTYGKDGQRPFEIFESPEPHDRLQEHVEPVIAKSKYFHSISFLKV